jgi:cathepsin B
MKLLALPLLALSVSAFVVQSGNKVEPGAESLTGPALVDYVNKKQNLWKAEVPSFSVETLQKKLMDVKYAAPPSDEHRAPEMPINEATIPDSFDARTQWPKCPSIGYIRDQSDCGSCWSFGAAEAMSDRTCIQSNAAFTGELSSNDILSCCGRTCGDGCQGGYPIEAWKYWVNQGVVTGANYADKNSCQPYSIAPCGHHAGQTYYGPCPNSEYPTPSCKKECQSGYSTSWSSDKHYGKTAYAVGKTVAAIQQEIMTNGPVEAAYTVYEDFYNYKSGVYVHTSGRQLGGHAVRILGWGVSGSTPYWLVANSWNTDWGENGYFRIIRGTNECGIEHAIVAGMAKV